MRARSLLIAMLGAAIAILAVVAPAVRVDAASVSTCTTTSGVTVIVDFTHFSGNIERGCAAGRPATALAALEASGFATAGTANYGDAFLCRIDGLPLPKAESCATTPPAKSSWSFYWAHATDAAWTYSATGVLSYVPPEGTIIAFAFGNKAKPGILPTAAIVHGSPTTTKPVGLPTTTTHAPVTTRTDPPVKGQGPTPGSTPHAASPTPTSVAAPNAPATTKPASMTPTTKVPKPKPAKPKPAKTKPSRTGTRAPTTTRSVPTSTSVPLIVDKVASGGGGKADSAGSPFAVILTVAFVTMLGVAALINIRDRRRRTA